MRTHCVHGHEFTPENIIPYGPNKAWRRCRACERDREQGRKREYEGLQQRVVCPKCGESRNCSKRNARRIEAGLQSGLCGWCRNPNRRTPLRLSEADTSWMTAEERKSPKETWARFTQEEKDWLWQTVSLGLENPESLRRAA